MMCDECELRNWQFCWCGDRRCLWRQCKNCGHFQNKIDQGMDIFETTHIPPGNIIRLDPVEIAAHLNI